jgi:hypothetical protein
MFQKTYRFVYAFSSRELYQTTTATTVQGAAVTQDDRRKNAAFAEAGAHQ